MAAITNQPWRISINAQSKNFNFNFKASRIFPSWGLTQTKFTILLKLRQSIIKLSSRNGISVQRRRGGCMKSNLLRVWKKIRFRPARKNGISALTNPNMRNRCRTRVDQQGAISYAGVLAYLSRSISERNLQGIINHASSLSSNLSSSVEDFLPRHTNLSLIMVMLLAGLIGLFRNYRDYMIVDHEHVWTGLYQFFSSYSGLYY